MHYLLMYRSLTYAQRSARLLERMGITGTVTRVPRSVSARGCAYGVLIARRHRERSLQALSAEGFAPERVYIRDAAGALKEAADDLA